MFGNMTHDEWMSCIKPKVHGSWNLHESLPSGMDFFVTLSSVASITGSRGQANYAAANAYQDALVRHRIHHGERAFTLNLGPVLDVGFAAENDIFDMLAVSGFEGITKDELLRLLELACDPHAQHEHHQIITGLGGVRHLPDGGSDGVYWLQRPLFSAVKAAQAGAEIRPDVESQQKEQPVGSLLTAASIGSERHQVITDALVSKLARALSIPAEDVDTSKPIYAAGVDSLVALEIRYWLMKEVKANISVLEVMSSSSLHDFAAFVETKSEYAEAASK